MGYTREAAARYSFLLAIPAVFGSGLYQLYKVVSKEGITGPYGLAETALATVSPSSWVTSSSAGS